MPLNVKIGALIVAVLLLGLIINSILNQPSTDQTALVPSELRAAIVDQGSFSPVAGPNPVFIETATDILKQAGYTVDYYPSENVTVEFYRNLPTHAYSIIILRAHSTAKDLEGPAPVVLFTSERHGEEKNAYDQLDGVVQVAYSRQEGESGIQYFGIDPSFVSKSMKGRFQNTLIIMMGCEGLANIEMAKAFVERGAKVYVGWSGPVSACHTDAATSHLLQHFISENLTLKKSVQETFKEVQVDPPHKSLLTYYPLEVGDKTIEDIILTGERD